MSMEFTPTLEQVDSLIERNKRLAALCHRMFSIFVDVDFESWPELLNDQEWCTKEYYSLLSTELRETLDRATGNL